MLATRILLAFFLAYGSRNSMARTLRLHESRATVPAGFSRVSSADPDTMLSLRLGLVSKNANELIETLYDVSTPSGPHYGQHLSRSDVRISHPERSPYVLTVNPTGCSTSLAFVRVRPGCERLVGGE